MGKKKGILQSEILTYALMSIGVALLLILAVSFISKFQEQRKEIEYIQIRNEIGNVAKVLANQIGTVKKVELSRPDDLKYLCMVNLAKKEKAYEHGIISKYPEVVNALKSGTKKNTFLLSDTGVLDMAYIEFLCPQPSTYCKINPTDIFELYFVGVPGCTSLSGSGGGGVGTSRPCDPAVCNQPNPIYFCGSEVGSPAPSVQECNAIFLVKDSNPTPYQDILKIIPATQFPAIGKNFPYIAYFESERSINKDDIADLIEKKKVSGFPDLDTAIVIDGSVLLADNSFSRNGTSYSIIVRGTSTPSDYISFWYNDTIRSISLISGNSEPIALKAALHAAKMSSSPLFFVDSVEDLDDIKSIKKSDGSSLLSGRIMVYTVENEALGILLNQSIVDVLEDMQSDGNITIAPRDTDSSPFIDELAGEFGYDTKLGSVVSPKD